MRRLPLFAAALLMAAPVRAAEPSYGPELEGFDYPHPIERHALASQGEKLAMAYMDVAPTRPNGRTVVLLHGRNFPSSYWAPVIKTLTDAGYRVVVDRKSVV